MEEESRVIEGGGGEGEGEDSGKVIRIWGRGKRGGGVSTKSGGEGEGDSTDYEWSSPPYHTHNQIGIWGGVKRSRGQKDGPLQRVLPSKWTQIWLIRPSLIITEFDPILRGLVI